MPLFESTPFPIESLFYYFLFSISIAKVRMSRHQMLACNKGWQEKGDPPFIFQGDPIIVCNILFITLNVGVAYQII